MPWISVWVAGDTAEKVVGRPNSICMMPSEKLSIPRVKLASPARKIIQLLTDDLMISVSQAVSTGEFLYDIVNRSPIISVAASNCFPRNLVRSSGGKSLA